MTDIYYDRFVPDLEEIQNPTLNTVGIIGTTGYSYQISAFNWNGETLATPKLELSTGNAILSTSDFNLLVWDAVEGATGYCIYGRTSGATYGLLFKSLLTDFTELSGGRYSWSDQGQNTADNAIQPPTVNTTGRQEWDSILFRAGKPLQSAELNEVQSIQNHYLDKLGRSLFSEGGIVKGCSPSMAADGLTITVPEGEVFIVGKVRPIPEGVVTITGTGAESIGLLVTEHTETEVIDSALCDPAVGSNNYEKDGAHRRVYRFTWVVNNPNAVKVFSIDNGSIIVANSETDYSKFNKLLAQRTFEESGNYVVEDTPVLIKENLEDPATLSVCVSAIKAYVQGYRVERTKGSVLTLNKSRATRNVPDEQISFTKGTGMSNFIYELSNPLVKGANQLFCTVKVENENISKGSPNGQDFVRSSLVSIVSVTQDTTTYVEGVDYARSGNQIDWSLGGAEPTTGTSYSVTYTYRKQLVMGTRKKMSVVDEAVVRGAVANTGDNLAHTNLIEITSVCSAVNGGGTVYQVGLDCYMVDGQADNQINPNGQCHWNLPGPEPAAGSTYYVSYSYWSHETEGDFVCSQSYDYYADITSYGEFYLRDCIDFRHPVGFVGATPETGNINLDYDFYIPRRDLLVVNTSGDLLLLEGIPDEIPARPTLQEDCMAIAELYIKPYTYGPEDVSITPMEVKRSTMEDIKSMNKRITTIEYYQALSLLEQSAVDEYTIDTKSGILVDNFKGSSRSDVYFNREGVSFGVAFNAAEGCIQMQTPFSAIDMIDHVDSSSTTKITGKSVTLPYTNVLAVSQPLASQAVCVTPYLVFPWKGTLSIDPSEDYWVDTNQAADLRVTTGATAEEMDFWNTRGGWDLSSTPWSSHVTGQSSQWVNWGINTTTTGINSRQVTSLNVTPDSSTTSLGNRMIDSSIMPYIRPRIITLEGHKFRPNVELSLKMEDITLPLNAITPTVAGATAGTVMSDENGYFKARFTIPANTFNTGEREIKVYNTDGLSNHETQGTSVYNAFGLSNTRQNTYLTSNYLQPSITTRTEVQQWTTVNRQDFAWWFLDPLAQTFYFPQSFFLTRLGLFFASKDAVLPAIVEIRSVENGYPSTTVLATTTIYPADIQVSSDASKETVITFPQPVFIEKGQWYCVVIKADTTDYNMWVATMGGTDVFSNSLITKQTNDGVLFRSSNAVTWTADPTSDLKFNIYRAEFQPSANLVFDTFNGVNASILNLTTTEIAPGDADTDITSIAWQYDDQPISGYQRTLKANEDSFIGNEIANMKVRAVFSSNNTKLSPVLNLDRLGLVHSSYRTGTKSYITRNVQLSPNTFDNLSVIVEANKPNNTNVRYYYSTDNGYTWTEFVSPTSTTAINSRWTEYRFLKTGLVDQTQFRVRIDLISTITYNTPSVRKLRVIAY